MNKGKMKMLKTFNFFSFIGLRKRQFLEWDSYAELISRKEVFAWQQAIRKKSLKNIMQAVK